MRRESARAVILSKHDLGSLSKMPETTLRSLR